MFGRTMFHMRRVWFGIALLGYVLLTIELMTRTSSAIDKCPREGGNTGLENVQVLQNINRREDHRNFISLQNVSKETYVDKVKVGVHIRSSRNETNVDLDEYEDPEVYEKQAEEHSKEVGKPYFIHQKESSKEIVKHPELPLAGAIPAIVYYIWCGKYWFEFQHYLSMRSAIRYIQPDKIFLYYVNLPRIDMKLYNDWLDVIRNEFPFITMKKIKVERADICDNEVKIRAYAMELLTRTGGFYVHKNTVFTRTPHILRSSNTVEGITFDGGFLMYKPLHMQAFYRNQDSSRTKLKVNCGSTRQINGIVEVINYSGDQYCLNLPNNMSYIYPKDIWDLDSQFGNIARTIFYGRPKIPKAVPNYDELVPNIAHMVWMGGGAVDYLFYLSILSVLHIVKVDTLYIHGDKEPSGPLWDKVKHDERIVLVYRDLPETIYKSDVELLPHVSDIFRVDIMVKYGGIYVDTDAVFVKPIPDSLRAYDVVAAYDWIDWNYPCPDNINFGVTLGKRGAEFWERFQKSMSYWRENSWSFNGLRQPYRIMERHPELFHLDPRLQVICFNFLCHPTWVKDYHNEKNNHETMPLNWREDTYAFHWTAPVPRELHNETQLMRHDTMFSQIGKHILRQAGLLKEKEIGVA